MMINNVNFNTEFWAGKSLAKFKLHEGHHGLSDDQLEEAFFIINPGAKVKIDVNDKPNAAKGKGNERGKGDKSSNG